MIERIGPAGVARDILAKKPTSRVLFKADSSCFPTYADKANPHPAPACVKCGGPSVGASFISMQDNSVLGKTVGVVEFSCGCDGRKSFALTVANLYPSWRLISEQSPGVWSVAHLSAEQKEARCSPEL
jgi:hypothetical protein